MNSVKKELMKNFPNLYKNEIIKMIYRHNDERRGFGFEQPSDNTQLEELLRGNIPIAFINFLKKNYLVISINEFTPYWIFQNEKLMSYVVSKSSYMSKYIPNECVTPSIVSTFEDSLRKSIENNNYIPNFVSSIFLKNHNIFKMALEHCENDFNYTQLMAEIINNLEEGLVKEAIEIGLSTGRKMCGIYDIEKKNYYKFFKCEKSLEVIDGHIIDINHIKSIYDNNREYALQYFRKAIEQDKLNRTNYIIKSLNQDLYNIIFEYKIYDYFPGIFSDLEYEFYTPEIVKCFFLANREYRLSNEVFKSKEYIPVIAEVNLEFLYYFDLELLFEYANSFNDLSQCNKRIIIAILNKYKKQVSDTNIKKINDSRFLKYLLEDLGPTFINLLNYFSIFSKETLNHENLYLLLKLQTNSNASFDNNRVSVFSKFGKDVLSDESIFNYLLNTANEYTTQFLLAFDESVINEDNIELLINKLETINQDLEISKSISNSSRILLLLIDNGVGDYRILNKFNIRTKEIINNLFNKLSIMGFLGINLVSKDLRETVSFIDLKVENCKKSIEEIIDFHLIDKSKQSLVFGLWLMKEIKEKGITSLEIEDRMKKLLEMIKNELDTNYQNQRATNDFMNKVMNNTRDPFNYMYVTSNKQLEFITYIEDIYSQRQSEFVESLPNELIEKVNTKHISNIIKLLRELNVKDESIVQLSISIYMSLGYERAVDFLSTDPKKNYGPLNEEKLNAIFNNINFYDILFEKQGNGFAPVLNEKLLNIIFGKNNKAPNTPIKIFLSDFESKTLEIQKAKEEIDNNLELTFEEKSTRKNELDKQLEEYKKKYNDFFKRFGECLSQWDIIEEEFIKKKNKSKLEIKLNIPIILEILDNIKSFRYQLDDIKDAKLIESDVFKYVGFDTQFTTNPAQAPKRAIDLSREMENVHSKKFPNIQIKKGEYTIRVYHPQDRRILSAGYKSHCCFRPNGNADQGGKSNSLLRYCATTEYGGGVEIVDSKGEIILFSPLLRNGNTLMIHSIETELDVIPDECYQLLKEFAIRVIEESKNNNDNIDFVLISDLHYLKDSITEGIVPKNKSFDIYDSTGEYKYMYNNLNTTSHMILAHNSSKTTDDIKYGEVEKSYNYPDELRPRQIEIDAENIDLCSQLEQLRKDINELSNDRSMKLKNKEEKESFDLLKEIKDKKVKCHNIYKKILDSKKQRDYYEEIRHMMHSISDCSKELSYDDLKMYTEVLYSKNWYVLITLDKKIEYGYKESGKEKLNSILRKLKETTSLSISNEELEALSLQ